MDTAGIVPEEDIQEKVDQAETPKAEGGRGEEEGGGDERLSIFSDFLERLDLEKGDDEEDESKDK